ncbi:unnamed protein product [Trichobilharzia szidati]|nr:unnamed protein product [Trichobilharzia szidati]
MGFSDIVYASKGLVVLSPNGVYISSASQHKVVIRTVNPFQTFKIYSCVDIVTGLVWSADSLFILSILKGRNIVQIFCLENPEWTCKVDEGSAGLLSAVWAPDSRHFLTTTDFHLRITIWSVSEVSVSYLELPKACANNLAFCPGGRYMALLERRDLRDHLSLFDCRFQWTLDWNIILDTNDAENIVWSPHGLYILVCDNCLYYKAAIYNILGEHLRTYCAYKPGEAPLGIKSVSWHPTGQLLALGSYDQKCRLLNDVNWNCFACLKHPVGKPIDPSVGLGPSGRPIQVGENSTPFSSHRIDIYEECRSKDSTDTLMNSEIISESFTVQYKLINNSVTIKSKKPDRTQPFPERGIGLTEFSPDGRYLATRNDNCSNVIWIWSINIHLSLRSLLIHTSGDVSSLVWDPNYSGRLALCTGSDTVFLWTPQGCLTIQSPAYFNFTTSSLCWLPSGDGMLLKSKDEFCLCYLNSDDVDDDGGDDDDDDDDDNNDNNKVEKHNSVWKSSQLNTSNGELHRNVVRRNSMCVPNHCPPSMKLHGNGVHRQRPISHPNWLKHHGEFPSIPMKIKKCPSQHSRNFLISK